MHLEGWHGAWQGCSSARGAWNLGCAVSGIHLALTALTIQGVGILNLALRTCSTKEAYRSSWWPRHLPGLNAWLSVQDGRPWEIRAVHACSFSHTA